MRVETDVKLGYKDVLIRPKRSTLRSRKDVCLSRDLTFKHSGICWSGVPIIAANMDTVGTFKMSKALSHHQMLTAVHKHYSLEDWNDFLQDQPKDFYKHFMVSTGITPSDFEKLQLLMQAHPQVQFICIDVANGYTEYFVDYVKRIRECYPDKTVIAGNVVTGEMVEELILAGADMVKVGIGPGSVCTTRVKTGVGYPQLSAVIECADAAHGLGGHVIADGGCVCPGDIAKAFGAGADLVMLGGMLAGCTENSEEVIEENGKQYSLFYGMSSSTAMEKNAGGVSEYRTSEGKTVKVPFKGPVEKIIQDILGGVRSACTYIGASRIKELPKRTTFVQVREQENRTFD